MQLFGHFVKTNYPRNTKRNQRHIWRLRNSGKTHGGSYLVMAGLVPAIPIVRTRSPPNRHRRDKPGDDELAATRFAAVTRHQMPPSYRLRAVRRHGRVVFRVLGAEGVEPRHKH